MPDLSTVTHEYFQSLLEQTFSVTTDGQTIALKVVDVRTLPPPKRRTLSGRLVDAEAMRLPFSVVFRSEGQLGLRQGTYDMVASDGGDPLPIFIVPLGFEDNGVVYEAIFT
ncbi:MAG TPA: hypothetical protein VGQ65_19725 [Thermoanaerobaculia bacterium]|jgi:hypothetical protein|nr:hypothetical protein [Thermoanaerobaculia bacterium]